MYNPSIVNILHFIRFIKTQKIHHVLFGLQCLFVYD